MKLQSNSNANMRSAELVLQTRFTSVTFTYMSHLPEVKIMDEREKLRSWLQNLAAAVRFLLENG